MVNAVNGGFINLGTGLDASLIQSQSIRGASQTSVGLFWDTPYNFQHSWLGYSELEVELYISQFDKQQSTTIAAFRPLFNFWGNAEKDRAWYWQFGVGLSYFDNKHLAPVTLSTHAQFATIVGLGLPLDEQHQHRLTLRYNHYSNGYVKRPNPGLDTLSLDWHFHF
jgi:lipid A 3-O-deacylase